MTTTNVKILNPISKEEVLAMADYLMDTCEQECADRGFSTPVCRGCQAAELILNMQKEIEFLRRLQNLEVKR